LSRGFFTNNNNNLSYEDILNHLFQQYQPQAVPPTSKKFIENCPVVVISGETNDICTVCQEQYKIRDEAFSLPCKHLFHQKCLIPWLETHNTCPTCRYVLPTEEDESKVAV